MKREEKKKRKKKGVGGWIRQAACEKNATEKSGDEGWFD